MTARTLDTYPVHLGMGGTMFVQPPFGRDMDWFQAYGVRHADDGAEGRLVCLFSFSENWASWERHPAGGEMVYCLEGELTLHQEMPDGAIVTTTLKPGEYAINPPNIWHTADVDGEVRALFITAGVGTENRPR